MISQSTPAHRTNTLYTKRNSFARSPKFVVLPVSLPSIFLIWVRTRIIGKNPNRLRHSTPFHPTLMKYVFEFCSLRCFLNDSLHYLHGHLIPMANLVCVFYCLMLDQPEVADRPRASSFASMFGILFVCMCRVPG
jgi:hypothetical protein